MVIAKLNNKANITSKTVAPPINPPLIFLLLLFKFLKKK